MVPVILLGIACLGAGAGEPAPAPAAAPPQAAPLELTVTESVLLALENNPELAVERLRPEVTRSVEGEERSIFDPLLLAEDIGWQRVKGEKLRGLGILEEYETESPVGRIAVESFLPTGTLLGVEASTEVADESSVRQLVQSRVGLTLSQSLLQGFGRGANQARVRAAHLDTEISEYELRGFTESFVALVERTYWDYALYRRQVEILDESLAMAEEQVLEMEVRVRIGTSAKVELAAARSEASLRSQDRIDAWAAAETARLQLLRLLNLGRPEGWQREIRLSDPIAAPDPALDDPADQVAAALRMRPEMNQARLLAERGDLELVRTRNGLLPRLDLFVSLGRSGYAESFSGSWKDLDADYDDIFAGLRFELPIHRSGSRARHERALAEKEQADRGIENLRQLVEMDVHSARVEVERTRAQVAASARTRELDEEKLAAEREKFRIGRASAFQVARALRDLTRSRLAEAAALVEAQKAVVELFRLDGSLLSRRGIAAPGQSPRQGQALSRN